MMNPKPGDMIRIYKFSHGYPLDWERGTEPVKFNEDTMAIFLENEPVSDPRTFYRVITDRGILKIFSGYIDVMSHN